MAKKTDAKSFALRKRKRRQWLTFLRMVRYGVNNFSRNAWLTIAATAVMTITLLIIFMTLVARNTLVSTVDSIRDNVDISIYMKLDTPQEKMDQAKQDLLALDTVREVNYISPESQREDFAKKNAASADTLDALNEAINKFPPTYRVNLDNINDTQEVSNFVKTNANMKEILSTSRPPSFAGTRKAAIEKIGDWVNFADKAGIVASIVFVVISSLIVFNTIRMAIYNRKEEIQMMKLIGADRSFIRGPFVVEAVVYGFLAAVLATGLGVSALYGSRQALINNQIAIQPTIDFILQYIGFVLLAMILVGSIIGVVSSLLATRRYLKI